MKPSYTVRHDATEGIQIFLAVAERRSFRGAAASLGVTPSAVSQAVRALETRLGAALFMRTTRSVGLTEAGQRFFERAAPAYAELVTASELVRDIGQRPTGLLRLSVPRGVVPLVLDPAIGSFSRAYPDVELEIAASEEMVDLAKGGFDAGIRFGQFISQDMVAIRLTNPFPFLVIASPDYLASHGRPDRIESLSDHACLRIRQSNGAIGHWSFVDGAERIEMAVSGPLIAHDYPTLLGAAIQGAGLAQVPGPLARPLILDGKLVSVLDEFAVTTPGVFLYHPGNRQMLPKLRAFIDHIKSR